MRRAARGTMGFADQHALAVFGQHGACTKSSNATADDHHVDLGRCIPQRAHCGAGTPVHPAPRSRCRCRSSCKGRSAPPVAQGCGSDAAAAVEW